MPKTPPPAADPAGRPRKVPTHLRGLPQRPGRRFPLAHVWIVALSDVDDPQETLDAKGRPEPVLNSAAVHAAKTLHTFMDAEGYCFPGVDKIATRSRVEERAVQRALRVLEHTGWLIRNSRGGRSTSSQYYSAIPGDDDALAARLVEYLEERADSDKTLPALHEALGLPDEKGVTSDAHLGQDTGHGAERGATKSVTRDALSGRGPEKGVVGDQKGVVSAARRSSEDPDLPTLPSPVRHDGGDGSAAAPRRGGEGNADGRSTKRRARSVRDTLGAAEYDRFMAELMEVAQLLESKAPTEGQKLVDGVAGLTKSVDFAQTMLRLIDNGWKSELHHVLLNVPEEHKSWAKTPYDSIRNVASEACVRVRELGDRYGDTRAVSVSDVLGGMPLLRSVRDVG